MLVLVVLFVTYLGPYFGRGEGEPLVCLDREVDDLVVLAI